MPRRRPPIDIFTFPVPERVKTVGARCPACDGIGEPYGEVGARMVFKCTGCSVRFKGPATAYVLQQQTKRKTA
jgi:hypothetical protein